MAKELKLVNMLRVGDHRIAIIEHDTSAGPLYSISKLYRSKEIAIQEARKMIASGKY